MTIHAFPSDAKKRRGLRVVASEDALTQMAGWIIEQSRRITALEQRLEEIERAKTKERA
jgi:hypothetical protein